MRPNLHQAAFIFSLNLLFYLFIFLLLECVAKRKEYLMALVAHFGHTRCLDINIGLEGVEVAIGSTVLVSQIDIKASCLHTQTTGEAMGILPVHIIGG